MKLILSKKQIELFHKLRGKYTTEEYLNIIVKIFLKEREKENYEPEK